MNNDHKLFYLQSLTSTAPTILFISIIPVILYTFEITDLSHLELVGATFLGIRLIIILGSIFAVQLQRKFEYYQLSSIMELASGITLFAILYSIISKDYTYFIITVLIRFFFLGIINNTRFSWLKNIKNLDGKDKIYVQIKALVQFSYFFAGLVILFQIKNDSLIFFVIGFDIITSLLGSFLFYKMKSLKTGIVQDLKMPLIDFFRNSNVRRLLFIDILMTSALGGINTFLFNFGESNLKNYGYGIALTLYSIFFLMSGQLIKHRLNFNNKKISYSILITFILTLIGMQIFKGYSYFIIFIIFSLMLFTYTCCNLFIEKTWFNKISNKLAAQFFAIRVLIISVINAMFEFVYSRVPNIEMEIRIAFSSFFVLMMIKYINSLKEKT